jgi:hypothetical protein
VSVDLVGTPLVVVAHPDDEIIWLAPATAHAATIIAAFPIHADDPAITNGRDFVLAHYPVGGFEFLPLREAGVYRQSDWLRRAPAPYGVTLSARCPVGRARRYLANYDALLELIEPYVRRHAVIYTHNPWGEYGHEEHVQVSNVVTSLARRYGCSVWAWDGLPERRLLRLGMRLRSDFYGQRPLTLPRTELEVDASLYRSIRQLYLSQGAWTWDWGYEPPALSTYIQLVRQGEVLLTPQISAQWSRPLGIASYRAVEPARSACLMLARAARAAERRIRPLWK